jgi:hypothetical protein
MGGRGGEGGGMGRSMRGDSDDSGLGLEERGGWLHLSLSPLGEGAPIRVLRQMDKRSPSIKLGAVGRGARGGGGAGGEEKLREALLAETVVELKTKLGSLKHDIERERELASVREREQLQELARSRAREREAEVLSEEQEREREKERTRDLVSTRVLRDQVSGLEEQLRSCQTEARERERALIMQVSGLEKQLQKHDAALVREQKTAQRLVDAEASRAAAQEALESERQTWQREKMQFQLRVDELLMLLQDARQVSFADI